MPEGIITMNNGLRPDFHIWGVRPLHDQYGAASRRVAQARKSEYPAAHDDQPPRPAWLNSILLQNDTSRIRLTESITREVFLHLATNLDPFYATDASQILILTGGFGIGKTAGLDEGLSRCGCHRLRIEAAELESPHAGVPAQIVRAKYLEASQMQEEKRVPCALIFEDIHLCFGVDDNTTRTINTQLAIATLMGFCDAPNNVRGTITHRVPVFATANDLTKVYRGLLRPGRTRVVAIEPSEADRRQIAMHVLRDLLLPQQVATLFDARPAWSIATFRQFKAELMRRSFDDRHQGKTAQQLLADLVVSRTGSFPANAAAVTITQEDIANAIRAIDAETDAKRDFTL